MLLETGAKVEEEEEDDEEESEKKSEDDALQVCFFFVNFLFPRTFLNRFFFLTGLLVVRFGHADQFGGSAGGKDPSDAQDVYHARIERSRMYLATAESLSRRQSQTAAPHFFLRNVSIAQDLIASFPLFQFVHLSDGLLIC